MSRAGTCRVPRIADLPRSAMPRDGVGFDRCWRSASAMAKALGGEVIQVSGWRGDASRCDPCWARFMLVCATAPGSVRLDACASHHAALVDGVVIGATIRQFDRDLSIPLLEPLEAYRRRWTDLHMVPMDGTP